MLVRCGRTGSLAGDPGSTGILGISRGKMDEKLFSAEEIGESADRFGDWMVGLRERVDMVVYPTPNVRLELPAVSVLSSSEVSYFSFIFSSLLESSSKTDFLDRSFCTIAEGWAGFMSKLNLDPCSCLLDPEPGSRV